MSSLSKLQLRILAIEAGKAYEVAASNDLLDLPAEVASCGVTARRDFWRQRETAVITGLCSFKDLNQDHYRPLLAHFQTLSGNSGKAFDTAHRDAQDAACHRDPGCEYVRQMHHWMSKAGYSTGYMIAIMKAKFRGCSELTRLSENQLKQLHDTVLNRCRKKLHLSEPGAQNKKQTRSRQQAAMSPASDDTAPAPQPARERTYVLKPATARRPERSEPESEADPF